MARRECFLTRSILDWRKPRGGADRGGQSGWGGDRVSAHLGSAGLMRPWAARGTCCGGSRGRSFANRSMRGEWIAGTQRRGGWAGRGPHVECPQMLLRGRATQEELQPLLYRALHSRAPGAPSVHQEDMPGPRGPSGTQQLALMSGTSATACQQARHLHPSSVQGTPSPPHR